MSSGLAIHEREREEERRRRARLARQASSSGDTPLFDEPRRVQPSSKDALQQKIQATLGEFNDCIATVFHHQNLYGVTRLPQTPVEGNQKFMFDARSKDSKNTNDLRKAKAMISNNQPALMKKTVNIKEENSGLKAQKVNGVLNNSVHVTTKSPLVAKAQETVASSKHSTLSNLKSPTLPTTTPSKVELKKTEVKPVVNGVLKVQQGEDKVQERGKLKVKEEKDKRVRSNSESENNESGSKGLLLKSNSSAKSKPPKIKLPERSVTSTSAGQENHLVNEPTSVERIIAEMQQVAPPLTGIHTPNKGGNSIFAFGPRNISQESTVLRKLSESAEGKKENRNGEVLLNDLELTDDSDDEHEQQADLPSKTSKNTRHRSHSTSSSGSSSDDSDSDSSDSDSDSSASDSNNNTKDKSMKLSAKSPSSSPKPVSGRNWGLNHFVNALNQSSTPPTTKTKPSPSAANTVGEDGVRGNQVAPAANASKSSLNSHFNDKTSIVSKERKSPGPTTPVDSLAPFAVELLSNSPEVNQGLDIESLTAKLDAPLEADTATNPSKPSSQTGQNGLTVKIQLPKGSKKDSSKSSSEPKLKSSQEKTISKKIPSPKKPVKTSKKETKTPKTSTNAKVFSGKVGETGNKVSKTSKSGVTGSKPTKKKAEMKSSNVVVTENEAVKPVSEVDDEDVIVDILGENSPAKLDSKPVSAVKGKETEKPKVSKSKPVVTNGHSKPINGENLLSSLISPNRTKDILGKNVEITYDEVNKPESLIVKIDLSLLKRIPKLPGSDPIKQEHAALTSVAETNGVKDAISSPEVKIPKRKSSDAKPLEHEVPKKVKSENDIDSSLTKPCERSSSSSSTSSRHNKSGHRKRSPSQEKDSCGIKRQRRDSENNKSHENSAQVNGSLAENGVDVVDKGLKPHQYSCSEKNDSDNDRREADISRFYDPEPRVPYGPDHYLAEAKKRKHKADSSTDKDAKAFFYIEAVMYFARCGKAIEQNEEESRTAFQMYSDTLNLLRHTMQYFVSRYTHRSHNVPDKRLSALCMRIQSILYMRLYKLRKDQIMRNVKMVTEHFRGPPKSTQAPSPYTSNTKMTGTPSPLSPTPSPSGSVGSVGSNGSNETMTTPSRNNKPSSASSAMTSPVNVCIPQKIHSMTQQHVLLVNNLVYSQDTWDQAQPVVLEFREFFMDLDRTCGPLTLHSSIVHMIEYIEEGVKRIRDALKAKNS